MAVKKKVTSRAEAGLVEEDAEIQPNDEVIAAGEHLSFEDEDVEGTEYAPSAVKVAGMSEEEQEMEMTPVVVGPPAYGSPEPATSAGRLLPLDEHPFNPSNLPEDHPAAIDESYGEGYTGGTISPDELGTNFPGAPGRTDLETALLGEPALGEEVPNTYEERTKADLLEEAEGRSLDVNSSNTKAEIITALEEDDAAS